MAAECVGSKQRDDRGDVVLPCLANEHIRHGVSGRSAERPLHHQCGNAGLSVADIRRATGMRETVGLVEGDRAGVGLLDLEANLSASGKQFRISSSSMPPTPWP